MKKLIGIQWIRAIAILAVLGFHLFPDSFPNGYLGVDLFFVVSGYLMTKIIHRLSESLEFKKILSTFYRRRFVRIFPNYFFMLFYTIIFGRWFLKFSDFEYLRKDSIWACFFVMNLKPILEQESYFKLTSSFEPLLHTWSLGVEIQFYIFAPFLFYTLCLSSKQIYLVVIFIILSIFYQIFLGTSPEAFQLIVCRLWQFLTGSLAFYISQDDSSVSVIAEQNNKEEESMLKKEKKTNFIQEFTALLITLFICFFPINITELWIVCALRSSVTFLTGYLILREDLFANFKDNVFNRMITYIGDISYSIYLSHWPIIVLSRYFGYDITPYGLYFVALFIAICSIVQYEFFEKFFLNRSTLYSVISVFLSIIGIFLLTATSRSVQHNSIIIVDPEPISIKRAIEINEQLQKKCIEFPVPCNKDKVIEDILFKLPPDDSLQGRCVVDLNENGHLTAVVMGNSYVSRHVGVIIEALKSSNVGNQFKKFYIVSRKACPSFDSTLDRQSSQWQCPLASPLPQILSVNPNFSRPTMERKYVDEQLNSTWVRMKEATNHCGNCDILEIRDVYCNKTTCEVYDGKNNIAYFCDASHMTEYGAARILPALTKKINEVMKI